MQYSTALTYPTAAGVPIENLLKSFALCVALTIGQPALADCSPDKPESFDEFLPRFSTEKSFAIERTKLPLKIIRWNDSVDIDGRRITDPQKFDLSLAEYWRWPTLSEYILDNHLASSTGADSAHQVRLELTKADSPLRVSYLFGSHEGCWILEHYETKLI